MRRKGHKKQRRVKLSKAQAKAFLATPKGQDWLERKIAEKHRLRPDPGLAPERLIRTKFPFVALINGRKAWVSRSAYGIEVDYE